MKTPTMYRIIFSIFTGLLTCLPLAVNAAFITDKIVAEVRTERFDQGAVLKELSSGASVEVLMSDGKYTRVRTTDNITGWVNSRFLTNEKPNQLEHLELLSKIKATEEKLRTAEAKLASASATGSDINTEEIEILKKQAKDTQWMKAEMQKARRRAEKAEEKLKAELKKQSKKGEQNNDTQQQLEDLRTQNHELETRLAAALLINEQQSESTSSGLTPVVLVATPITGKIDDNKTINIQWFWGGLLATLVIGFIAGFTWLDKRIRRKHGGFRIY